MLVKVLRFLRVSPHFSVPAFFHVFKTGAGTQRGPAFPYLVRELLHSSLVFAQTLDCFNIALLFVFNFSFKFTDLNRKMDLNNILLYLLFYFVMSVVCLYVYVHHRGQKWASAALELELQTVVVTMWVLGTDPGP